MCSDKILSISKSRHDKVNRNRNTEYTDTVQNIQTKRLVRLYRIRINMTRRNTVIEQCECACEDSARFLLAVSTVAQVRVKLDKSNYGPALRTRIAARSMK